MTSSTEEKSVLRPVIAAASMNLSHVLPDLDEIISVSSPFRWRCLHATTGLRTQRQALRARRSAGPCRRSDARMPVPRAAT
ncbi:MAG: hypothetical protein U0R26_10625 [Solirubrobacterales bacterium]